ncbi:H-NS histone family protein [Pseudothauera nasutitermitis]|uniref:H-NS histone family protein n=1 Tax=Pseudothauera nasutitermitis TaxID=2565930 RepID=A0A4S4AVL6_9RHOO|nr:H-NS histone family protein [Pseudothauera nasutitermitis]THF63610.1 H-NS histone family protein [Pseudothauera nasutitermitis]
MELAKLSLTELRRLQSKVETEIRRRSDTARRDLLKKIQKLAAEEGLSLSDVIPGANVAEKKAAAPKAKRVVKASAKKGTRVPAKYRHPEDATLTWSGRGRKPLWVEGWLGEGKPLDALLIQQAA